MATVKELTYSVWKILDGREPTDDSRYSYRQIRIIVLSALSDAMKRDWYEQRNTGDTIYGNDNYSSTYRDLEVMTDSENGLKYIEVPARTISIPGGRDVSITDANPVSRWSKKYIPVSSTERFSLGLQPSIPCVILYYKQDNKYWFYNGIVNENSLDVTLRYAIPDNDDVNVNMPEEFHNYVVQTAVQTLNPQLRPVDHNNDGTEN